MASKCYIWFLGQIITGSVKDFQLKTLQFQLKYDKNNLPNIPLNLYTFTMNSVSLLYMLSLQRPNESEGVVNDSPFRRIYYDFGNGSKSLDLKFKKKIQNLIFFIEF